MILQSHQSFDMLAHFDPSTGTLTPFSRSVAPDALASGQDGVFDYLGGKRVLLYRLADALFLEVDGRRLPLLGHDVEVHPGDGDRVLRVLDGGAVVFELTYYPPDLDPPLSEDPTAFAEEETSILTLPRERLARPGTPDPNVCSVLKWPAYGTGQE